MKIILLIYKSGRNLLRRDSLHLTTFIIIVDFSFLNTHAHIAPLGLEPSCYQETCIFQVKHCRLSTLLVSIGNQMSIQVVTKSLRSTTPKDSLPRNHNALANRSGMTIPIQVNKKILYCPGSSSCSHLYFCVFLLSWESSSS